jgi:hypothetical protein
MFTDWIILAIVLNIAHVAALNKRGFALGSYYPKTRIMNRPIPRMSKQLWTKTNDQQQSKTALSAAFGILLD